MKTSHPSAHPSPTTLRRVAAACVLAVAVTAIAAPSGAQPFGAWMTTGTTHGFVEVPHSTALNPTAAFTLEAWVNIAPLVSGNSCRSLVGKNYQQSWWVGVCGTTLRSYLKGSSSLRDAGTLPTNEWTHIAIVFDGATRKHYINGELQNTFAEVGPLTTSTSALRIASDVVWQFTPQSSAIDEVRLWNVARTEQQLRDALNEEQTASAPGLVAVWNLNGNASDALGAHSGTVGGSGIGALTFPVASGCAQTATALCLDGRFQVTVDWRTPAPSSGPGMVASCGTDDSGIFYFFNPDKWEVLAKTLNACSLYNRYWVFFSSTTNVYYRMEVFDVVGGANKIYFNSAGPPAPAITDTSAFATCP